MTLEDRFWPKVKKSDGCWEWQGAISGGYGMFRVMPTAKWAHRVAYELVVGPIPAGLTLDHLCRNTRCVRPDHLEPVTMGVNTLRGGSPTANNARKTHCKRGHPFDEANTYRIRPSARLPDGGRRCRACAKERERQAA